MNATRRHDGFLSYSHADAAIARELERGLEKLAKPLLKLRALDIFRDESGLASSPGLWPSILEHLSVSGWFLLLASPQSAASPWCTKEITWWLENRSSDRLLLLITDGEIVWNAQTRTFDVEKTTALSPALSGRFAEEPLYTDLRWARGADAVSLHSARFRDAVLNVAAPLRGVPKDELDGVDVRQLRKNRRFVRSLFASIAAAALLAVWQWRSAVKERDAAEAQARVATSRKLVAESRLTDTALDAALLTAAEAYQIAPTRDAHENLIRLVHENDRFEQFLRAHGETITAVAFSPDGTRLLTGDEQGRVVLWTLTWDAARRAFRRAAEDSRGRAGAVTALGVNRTGNRAAVAYGDGGLAALQIGESTLKREEIASCSSWHDGQVSLSADGSRAAVRDKDGRVSLWDIQSSGCSLALSGGGAAVKSFGLSPSGNLLAAVRQTGEVIWWNASGGTGRATSEHGGDPYAGIEIRVSDDDRLVAVAGRNHLELWALGSGGKARLALAAALDSPFNSMAFSRDARKLAVGLADGSVDLWRIGEAVPVRDTLRGHRFGFNVLNVAFNQRGDLLASAGDDGVVMLWYFGLSGRDKPLARDLRGHAGRVSTLTFDGNNRLVSSNEGAAIVWNTWISGDRPFFSYVGRNELLMSSYYDPVTNTTLAVPGILTDIDKDACRLIEQARFNAGRMLTANEQRDLVGDLKYTPSCPRPQLVR